VPTPPPFPTVRWKREWAFFVAADALPADGTPQPAALVFPFYGDRVALADIATRGWCIPSGHVEPGETPEEAVRREALEEAGVVLGETLCLGYFVLRSAEDDSVRFAPTYIADVRALEDIPPGSESRGRQLVPVEEIADLYFSWDALLAAVFEYAYAAKEERLRAGVPLAAYLDRDGGPEVPYGGPE
jgi:8-oxo-dGTP diphosphatase